MKQLGSRLPTGKSQIFYPFGVCGESIVGISLAAVYIGVGSAVNDTVRSLNSQQLSCLISIADIKVGQRGGNKLVFALKNTDNIMTQHSFGTGYEHFHVHIDPARKIY